MTAVMDYDEEGQDETIRDELIAFLPALSRFALALTRSRPDADDLVQETCERAIRNLDKWQPGTRLDSWLFRIAHNLFRNHRRKSQNAQRTLYLVGTIEQSHDSGTQSPESQSIAVSASKQLLQLPREQREVVMLVCVEGYSYEETATILDLPIGTVTSRLGRARSYLRDVMLDTDHATPKQRRKRHA